MNEEEREIVKKFERLYLKDFNNEKITNEDRLSYIECVLMSNLIEKLQKENEEIRIKNNVIKRESEAYAEHMIRLDNELNLEKEKSKYEWIRQNCLSQELVNKLYIPIQKVKDKIEDLKMSGGSDGKDNTENTTRELVIEALQDILDESKEK